MIKMFGSLNQLSGLTFEELKKLSMECHIECRDEVSQNKDERIKFERFIAVFTGITGLIRICFQNDMDIYWKYNSNLQENFLWVNGSEFEDSELQYCLWKAVKKLILENRDSSISNGYIEHNITMEQLNTLSFDELCKLSEALNFKDALDIEKDDYSITELKKKLRYRN